MALTTAVQKFAEELKTIRSSRPSVQLVEDIRVDYYGEMLPIKQLGSISIHPPKNIEIQVWDKNAASPVMKAIEGAGMGLSVGSEGNIVRATLPPLTDERRAEFTKLVKKLAEATRIQIRGRRDDSMKKLKGAEEAGKLSEDQVFKAKERAQKLVDNANRDVETALESKLKELQE